MKKLHLIHLMQGICFLTVEWIVSWRYENKLVLKSTNLDKSNCVEQSLLWVFRIVDIPILHHLGQCILGIQISNLILLEFKFVIFLEFKFIIFIECKFRIGFTIVVSFRNAVKFSFNWIYFFFILRLRCRSRGLLKVRVLRIVKFEIGI